MAAGRKWAGLPTGASNGLLPKGRLLVTEHSLYLGFLICFACCVAFLLNMKQTDFGKSLDETYR